MHISVGCWGLCQCCVFRSAKPLSKSRYPVYTRSEWLFGWNSYQ